MNHPTDALKFSPVTKEPASQTKLILLIGSVVILLISLVIVFFLAYQYTPYGLGSSNTSQTRTAVTSQPTPPMISTTSTTASSTTSGENEPMEDPAEPATPNTPSTGGGEQINLRVMTINYNAYEGENNAASQYFSTAMAGKSVKDYEKYLFTKTVNQFKSLSGGRITFNIAYNLDIKEFPTYPDGSKFTLSSYQKCVWGNPGFDPSFCDKNKMQFDYVSWAKKYKICELADQHKIDEIWMVSLPYILTWENFMIGPTEGFAINGQSYKVIGCKKHYAALNATYDRPDTLLHNFGHRVEATLEYLTQNWTAQDKQKYVEQFLNRGAYDNVNSTRVHCGNAHFPFNTTSGYDYGNTTIKSNNCKDWKNFPNLKGEVTTQVSCKTWGCNDEGWQQYWLQNIPASAGSYTMTSKTGKRFTILKDWWQYFLFIDKAIAFVAGTE